MAGDGLTAAADIPGGAAVETQYAAAKTSVWWDIENCQVPRGCDPYTVAQNISAALMKMNYHGPVTISAYGDTNRIPWPVQNALSSTGIGLNHVPAGVKDASDKKILVDMLFWAVDNPAPANYLLISGDRDFSNAIHQLRMRRYNILLAQPLQASAVLAAAAKNVWQWTSLAAGGFPRELAYGIKTLRQESTLTPITKPDTKTKAIYVPKNSNQLNMTGMSSMPARIEETSSSHCPQEPDVAPKQFAPHQFFAKADSSENHSSKFIENKYAQHTQSQLLLVPDKIVKSNSCQNNLQPAPPPPEGSAVFSTPFVCHPDAVRDGSDISGSLNKGPARPDFSFPSSSLGVSKSVPCNSDLGLQLPEHIEGLIGVVLLALNTLKLEKIAPTEENITYCVHYGNSKDRHTDVTAALNSALEQQMILKIKVGNLELYVGRTERIWNCVNPLGGNINQYRDATWNAIEKFLCSATGRSAIAASECRYEAALILKNSCLEDLTLGEVIQILDMIITLKRWIKTSHSGWQPVVITLPETNNNIGTRIGT